MKKYKTLLLFVLVVVLAVLFYNVFRNIYSNIYPLVLSEGFFEVFKPGSIEGFLLAFLFFLPLIYIPGFWQNNLYVKLIPLTVIGLLLMAIPWQALILALAVNISGILLGLLAVYLRKLTNRF